MKRRLFLAGTLGVAVGTMTGCRRAPRREEVLASLVSEVVIDEAREARASSDELGASTSALGRAPSQETVRAARQAWKRAALAFKRASAFSLGPLAESGALAQALYFPARGTAIENMLSDTRPVSRDLVLELGADQKGLYGLEALLFDGASVAPARVNGPSGERARLLVNGFASDLIALADSTLQSLGEPGAGFSRTFSAQGHEALSHLVNQMIESVETLAENRLSLALEMAKVNRLEARDVEGYASGTSHELALSLMLGLQRLYRGGPSGGLRDLAQAVSPDIAGKVSLSFDRAVADLRHLGRPIEVLAKEDRPRLEGCVKAVKTLEVALKADLANALGVTLAFRSGDGD